MPPAQKAAILKLARDELLLQVGEHLYPYQRRFSDEVIDSLILRTGTDFFNLQPPQSGKSFGISRTILPLLIYYDAFFEPIKIGCFAPTYKQASIIFQNCKQLYLRALNAGIDLPMVENNRDVMRFGESELFTRSAEEGASPKGVTGHLILVDEAPEIPDLQLREAIRFRGAATNATYVYIGSPAMKMKNRFFFDGVQRGEHVHRVEWQEAAEANPQFKAFVEKMFKDEGEDSDFVRMQIKLDWILGSSNFTNDKQMMGMRGEYDIVKHAQEQSIFVGIDWGKMNDSTVVTILAKDGALYRVLDWMELKGDPQPDQMQLLTAFLKNFKNIERIAVDSTATQYQATDYVKLMVREQGWNCPVEYVIYNQQSKHDLFYFLQQTMLKGNVQYPRPPQGDYEGSREDEVKVRRFERQMLMLEKEWKGSIMSCEAPKEAGAHDDYPNSLALALYAGRKGKVEFVVGTPMKRF